MGGLTCLGLWGKIVLTRPASSVSSGIAAIGDSEFDARRFHRLLKASPQLASCVYRGFYLLVLFFLVFMRPGHTRGPVERGFDYFGFARNRTHQTNQIPESCTSCSIRAIRPVLLSFFPVPGPCMKSRGVRDVGGLTLMFGFPTEDQRIGRQMPDQKRASCPQY